MPARRVGPADARDGNKEERMNGRGPRGRPIGLAILLTLAAAFVAFFVWKRYNTPQPGHVLDEALTIGRQAETFRAADEDYFHDMDSGVPLTPEEVAGRNTWLVWTAGTERFWDKIGVNAVGALDFLKTVSSHPKLKFSRGNRWEYLGLVNEPCFGKATRPDQKRFGLWLDRRSPDCPPDPFENEQKYP